MELGRAFQISVAVEVLAGLYLLIFDRLLQSLGRLHWAFLLFYLASLTFLAIGYARRQGKRLAIAAGVLAILAFVAMLLDAALGLPLSGAYNPGVPNFGWGYLFGFGIVPGSLLATSLAFTILFLFSVVIFLLGYLIYRKG